MTSRHLQFFQAIIAGTAVWVAPSVAFSQEQQSYQFDMPSQDLGEMLRGVAARAGWEIFISADDIRGLSGPALRGRFTPSQAIDHLLSGTRLFARYDNGSVIIRSAARQPDTADPQVEAQIVVTGTRIEGAPPAAPVTKISQEDIRNAGQADLGEVARSLPQNFGGGQNPGIGNTQGTANENGNVNGASTFNLRGIGPNATLTLINGNRFSYSGTSAVIDVSAIPVAAVERVEVITDGASAIYGADAVAGVVNIILRPDYDGVSTSARIGASTDGGFVQQQYNALAGSHWSNGGFVAVYDYSRNSSIDASDRSYAVSSNPETAIYPAIRRHSLLLSGHQDLAQGVTLSADLIFKTGVMTTQTGFTIDQPVTDQGLDIRTKFTSFGVAPTLSVDLWPGWSAKATGFYGIDRTNGLSHFYFGGGVSSTAIRRYNNENHAAEIGLQGPLFALPAGDARLAFGGGLRSYRFTADTSNLSFSKRRNNVFAYGELYLPLVSPAQSVSLVHRASVTGALRYEDYSDSGAILTPKISAHYEPFGGLDLAASWGRSFKLPTLYQQYSGYAAVLVPTDGYGVGFPAGSNFIYALGTNDQLRAERSENWTVSATFKPARDLELTASYFNIDYRDRVAPPIASGAGVLSNPIYSQLVTLNPGTALQAEVIAGATGGLQNATSGPYDPATVVAYLDARDRNIARQRYSGVDLAARYRFAVGTGSHLDLSAGGTWLDSSQQLLAGLPVIDLAGTIFNPPHFRARAGAALSGDGYSVAIYANHSGGVTDNRLSQPDHVGGMTTFDLSGRIKLWGKLELAANALNLFNAKPDIIFTASPYDTPFDSNNYSAIGRFLGLSVTYDW